MALGSTIFKATVQIADLNRHYYADHQLTLARHPSETDERLMIRLLSFLLHVDERLKFTKGLCADDEPDLWQHSLSGDIELWIDVGLPDERRVRKACSSRRTGCPLPLRWPHCRSLVAEERRAAAAFHQPGNHQHRS